MMTLFVTLSIINGILLFVLALIIFLKGRSKVETDYYRLEKYQKELMPYAACGTVLVILLSIFLMI